MAKGFFFSSKMLMALFLNLQVNSVYLYRLYQHLMFLVVIM